jgi:hypothetical protein
MRCYFKLQQRATNEHSPNKSRAPRVAQETRNTQDAAYPTRWPKKGPRTSQDGYCLVALARACERQRGAPPLRAQSTEIYITASASRKAHAHRTASTASPSAAARTRLQTTGAKPLLAASISAVIASCVALHGVIVRATVQHHSHIREDESHANRTTPAHSTPPDRSTPRPFESPTRAYIEPH